MVFKIAEVVRIPQQKVCERRPGEAWLASGTKIEGSTTHVGLCVVVIANLVLQTEVIPVAPPHQGQTGGQIVLRVPILNKTLPLRAHDVVGKIGDTWCRRRSRNCRYRRVVAGGPAER